MYNLGTAAHTRGKGLGAKLAREAMKIAKSAGYRWMVLQSSPKAIPLYTRLGFSPTGGTRTLIKFNHCGFLGRFLYLYLYAFGPRKAPLLVFVVAVFALLLWWWRR